ncbi:tRNA lysidine(34) synthetase TilS [Plesiomonas shigelloides]|uniref:tRNA lysidine(34) synthetase TilS n=1 Tax=Plesiomonas shigelloides TaxID=703 RepID=UPI00126222A0|nr:tRNA lysidine(34) synthetase TilS [Plesiomonas shigelloides]KAB7669124.1 tRNA lysidine(34) synthetase TilS [Plesiomonas shigelloides]
MNSDPILAQAAACIGEDNRVLVAYSGGVDSTVLLHLMMRLRQLRPELRVRAVHVHHGLSRFADEWALHCEQQCAQWQIPLDVVRVQVKKAHISLEASARDARYHAIGSRLEAGESLVTAQHLDDQCETVLLALKRGSGPAGLAAMTARMPFMRGQQVRPLLYVSRAEIEAYAELHQLSWVEDDSNSDPRFDRNFLRLQVIPELTARWPHFGEAVARSAALCGEQEELLDELLMESLQTLLDDDESIDIAGLQQMSEVKRQAILRRWFACLGALMPSREQLQSLWYQVAMARQDAEPVLNIQQWQVRRFKQRLYLLPSMRSLADSVQMWDGLRPLVLPDNLGELRLQEGGLSVRAPLPAEFVSVRFRAQGRFHIIGRNGSRQIKKIWQERGIPPWLRDRTPMLFYGETLIAAFGVFVTKEGQPQPDQPQWQIYWAKPWLC